MLLDERRGSCWLMPWGLAAAAAAAAVASLALQVEVDADEASKAASAAAAAAAAAVAASLGASLAQATAAAGPELERREGKQPGMVLMRRAARLVMVVMMGFQGGWRQQVVKGERGRGTSRRHREGGIPLWTISYSGVSRSMVAQAGDYSATGAQRWRLSSRRIAELPGGGLHPVHFDSQRVVLHGQLVKCR